MSYITSKLYNNSLTVANLSCQEALDTQSLNLLTYSGPKDICQGIASGRLGNMAEAEVESLIGKVINDIKAHCKYELLVSTEDLFDAGFVGFVKATTLFNPNKGAKFSTFCYRLIHNEICNQGKQLSTKELSISSLQGRYADDEEDKVCILDIYSSGESADDELVREDLRHDLKRVFYAILGSRNAEIIFGRFGLQGKESNRKQWREDMEYLLKYAFFFFAKAEDLE